MSNIHIIPDDLIHEEILHRLPVKTLLRFCCVSKSWQKLISSQKFIRKQWSYSSQLSGGKITNHTLCRIRDGYFHTADCDDNDSLLESSLCSSFDQLKLYAPRELAADCFTLLHAPIVGSCNGLVCLLKSCKDIVFWNPATRKLWMFHLPMSAYGGPKPIGFGYDSLNDDYKLVRIHVDWRCGSVVKEVKIYSLNANSWGRVIQDFPAGYRLAYIHKGRFASGALHWFAYSTTTASKDKEGVIVALDLAKEEYRIMPQPGYSRDEHTHRTTLDVLGDCLCVICIYGENFYVHHVDIWILKDYGVKSTKEYSWQKIISINRIESCYCHGETLKPLAYSKCGRRVLLRHCEDHLLWFDLEKQLIVNDPRQNFSIDPSRCLDIFQKSLVRVDGFKRNTKITVGEGSIYSMFCGFR